MLIMLMTWMAWTWAIDRPANDGEFPDWGNPIGEMTYETLRYFSGAGSPKSEYAN